MSVDGSKFEGFSGGEPKSGIAIIIGLFIEAFRSFVVFCVAVVTRLGVTPNELTYMSLAPAVAAGLAAATGHFYASAALIIVSGFFDLLDGATARETNQATLFGALLDSSIDRVSDGAPLAGLVFFFSGNAWTASVPCLAIVATFMISYIRARAEGLGAKLPWLWMRRAERLLLTAGCMILGGVHVPGLNTPAPLLLAGIGIMGILCVFAAFAALRAARESLS